MSRPFFLSSVLGEWKIIRNFASMKMKRLYFVLLFSVLSVLTSLAQYDFLTAHRGVIEGGYDF